DNINDISCAGNDNGGIAYTIEFEPDFNAPEQIIISDGNTTFNNGELSGGEYCMTVLDAAGCVAGSVCFEIEEPTGLEVEFSLVGGCNDDGEISLNITGGTEPYNVDWLDLAGNDNVEDRTGLLEGTYAVIITDANACSVVAMDLVVDCDDCNGPTVNFTATFDSECGLSIGAAQVNITEDPANFEFDWMPSGVGNLSTDGTQLSDIPAGIYSLAIKDTLNTSCSTDTILFAVQNSDGPQAEIDTIIAATCGLADGSVTLLPDTLTYEWTDGGTGAIRNDLLAGTYGIIFYDDADSSCINTVLVTVPENDGFELEATINQLPDCNTANGNVTIDVTGGSGNFTFTWSDGGAGQTRTDLTSGTYTVFVLDNDTQCTNELVFTLLDNVPQTATITINGITPIACNGVGVGTIDFDVVLDPTFNAPAEIIISDGLQTYEEDNLPVGEYCISVRDAEGCLVAAECFEIIESEDILVSINGTLAGCPDSGEFGSLDLTVTGGTAPYTFDWADITTGVEPEDRTDLVIGIYSVTITDANNCTQEINNLAINTNCVLDCGIFDTDSLDVTIFDCNIGAELCLDIPIAEYVAGEYDIFIDGQIQPLLGGCTTSDVGGYNYFLVFGQGDAGPYFLDSWEVNGVEFSGEFLDIPALVDSMNVWDIGGDWENVDVASLISGGVPGNTYGNMTIHPLSDPQSVATLAFNDGISSNGVLLTVGEGAHEVIIVNNGVQGCTDTLALNVTCLNLDVRDTLLLGSNTTFCLDSMQLADFEVVSNPTTVT
ncbi:MAG: SprB repeat-containing protein, partial [Saprospiraceae bacterium]